MFGRLVAMRVRRPQVPAKAVAAAVDLLKIGREGREGAYSPECLGESFVIVR